MVSVAPMQVSQKTVEHLASQVAAVVEKSGGRVRCPFGNRAWGRSGDPADPACLTFAVRCAGPPELLRVGEALLLGVACQADTCDSAPSGSDDITALTVPSLHRTPYAQVEFRTALGRLGIDTKRESDLTDDEDAHLARQFAQPFWLLDYPDSVRWRPGRESVPAYDPIFSLSLPYGYGRFCSVGFLNPIAGLPMQDRAALRNVNHPEQHGVAQFELELRRLGHFLGCQPL